MTSNPIPVITIDGPSGAGKGTVAMRLARELGFHLLDSGAVYRAAAVQVLRQQIDLSAESEVVSCVAAMNARFEPIQTLGVVVYLDEIDVTDDIRTETTAAAASVIAVMPGVRNALLKLQRSFAKPPGLVADGRDMGTVVFPAAWLKVYLTASATERAKRRHKQLNQKEKDVTLESLLQDIQLRDQRDSSRTVSPLVPADDALMIDSTGISIDAVVGRLKQAINEKRAESSQL